MYTHDSKGVAPSLLLGESASWFASFDNLALGELEMPRLLVMQWVGAAHLPRRYRTFRPLGHVRKMSVADISSKLLTSPMKVTHEKQRLTTNRWSLLQHQNTEETRRSQGKRNIFNFRGGSIAREMGLNVIIDIPIARQRGVCPARKVHLGSGKEQSVVYLPKRKRMKRRLAVAGATRFFSAQAAADGKFRSGEANNS